MRSLGMKLLAFAAVAMMTAPVLAQSDTYGTKADVAIELSPGKIITSPLGKKMGFAEQLEAMPSAPGAPDLSAMKRIFIGLVAPESAEKLEGIQSGENNDLEFFVRLEFATAEAADTVIKQAMDDNSGEVEKNGKTYYSPPEKAGMPEGTTMYMVDDKTVALTSPGFQDKTGGAPLTDALSAAWKTMPKSALKVSVDGVNARALMKSLVKEGKKNAGGNPVVEAVMDLFPTMDNINLAVDFATADLVKLHMVGSDEDKATDINDGFKSLVTMAKPMAKAGLTMLQDQLPDATATFGKVVEGMDVKQTGKNVTLNIPRPEGFEDAVQALEPVAQQMFFQMMMGGGGGGGF